MNDEQKKSSGGSGGSAGAARSYAFSPWKKLLCVLAGAALAGGVGLQVYGALNGPPAPAAGGAGAAGTAVPAGGTSFLPGDSPSTRTGTGGTGVNQPAVAEDDSMWSPLLIKGGGGFLMGFCIGFALRKFLRMSMVVVGIVLVGLFAFQYLGVINVNWAAIQEQIEVAGARLKTQFDSFQTFIAGVLPAGGLGAFGLFTGFKRR